ncbi:Ubiquitin conjugation factor E4 A [Eumeta japonica]|uniref:RING-type E3 ubiquitin transferase n=1 Tax=Eumeta variegata TaxID=151549 RepID=A0A4C1SPP3_EUMVA|nr:Ubiquitin conjugation factor E4 A [Eumeta japonica]
MKELIFRNAVTALKQPSLFEGQDFTDQLFELLQYVDPQSHTFFIDVVKEFVTNGGDENSQQLKEVMTPVLRRLHTEINKSNLINLPIYILPSVQLFANNPHLAPVLMEACEPKLRDNGAAYQHSVLGALLSLSVLPRTANSLYEFFENPMDQAANNMMESSLWNASAHLSKNMHKIFLSLLKGGPIMRDKILSWVGGCLKSNAARGMLWNVQAPEISGTALTLVSDGFMLNLGAVLLQLCQPFCTTHNDLKSLKIDPTYGAVLPEECPAKSVHLDCLHNETCLLPAREDSEGHTIKRPTAEVYNFVTECFFMSQKCIDLAMDAPIWLLHLHPSGHQLITFALKYS